MAFYDWEDNGDLLIDVDVVEPDGSKKERRVRITRARMSEVLSGNDKGMKFFVNDVMGRVRKVGNFNPAGLRKTVEFPKLMRNLQAARNNTADDLMPPQLRELEERLSPTPEIQVHYKNVTVGKPNPEPPTQ